jgi:hypothetical protein
MKEFLTDMAQILTISARLACGFLFTGYKKDAHIYVALNADRKWAVYHKGRWHTLANIEYYLSCPYSNVPSDMRAEFVKMHADLLAGVTLAKELA